jgi:hypothetical protein
VPGAQDYSSALCFSIPSEFAAADDEPAVNVLDKETYEETQTAFF